MGTHRPLALVVGSVLLLVLATGVAAAESGDGTDLVRVLEQLIAFLERVVEYLESLDSMADG